MECGSARRPLIFLDLAVTRARVRPADRYGTILVDLGCRLQPISSDLVAAARPALGASPALVGTARGRRSGALRICRAALSRRRRALPRCVGPETARRSYRLRGHVRSLAARSAVAGADLIAAGAHGLVAGTAATRLTCRHGGIFTAALYLLLANPAYTRLGGVRIRAQCETFIGLLVAAAVAMLTIRLGRGGTAPCFVGATHSSRACSLASPSSSSTTPPSMALPVAVALVLAARQAGGSPGAWVRRLCALAGWTACGAALPVLVDRLRLRYGRRARGSLPRDGHLQRRYSGETYASGWHMAQYLLTFPIRHAASTPCGCWAAPARPFCWWPRAASGAGRWFRPGSLPRVWPSPSTAAAACRNISSRRGRRWLWPRARRPQSSGRSPGPGDASGSSSCAVGRAPGDPVRRRC